jgi:hypothetical protein
MSGGSMLLTGDPTGTVAHAAVMLAQEIVQHVIIEHGAKLGIGMARAAVGGGDAAPDDDLTPDDIARLQAFLEDLAEAIANYDPEAEAKKKAPLTGDAKWLADWFAEDAEFEESKVTRKHGQFARKGEGEAGAKKEEPAQKEEPKAEEPKGLTGSQGHAGLISSRAPTAVGAETGRYQRADLEGMKGEPEVFAHNMNLLRNSRFYQNLNIPEDASPEQVADIAKEHAKKNLRFLWDRAPEALKAQGHLWYEGANKLAAASAEKYGLPLQTTAAVYAALSPQALWDRNVALAEQLIDIHQTQQHTKWDDAMSGVVEDKVRKNRQANKQKTPEQNAAAEARIRAEFAGVAGKRLDELTTPADKAVWIIAHAEAHRPRQFDRLSPDGNRLGTYVNQNGLPANLVSQTVKLTANAIAALESNGDRDKISAALGEKKGKAVKHKVRSFYNNILDPHSANEDVTMDTHAIGAALLRALGGSDVPVAHSLATAPKKGDLPEGWQSARSSIKTGSSGTYGLWADAYRELAHDLKVEPRVLQSVTWEAKRKLFGDEASEATKQAVEQAWRDHHDGKASLDATQQGIWNLAGGIEGKPEAGVAVPEKVAERLRREAARATSIAAPAGG